MHDYLTANYYFETGVLTVTSQPVRADALVGGQRYSLHEIGTAGWALVQGIPIIEHGETQYIVLIFTQERRDRNGRTKHQAA